MAQIDLRSYQIEAIHRIREAYRSGRRAPLFVLPTGGGKTYTFAAIVDLMIKKGKRITILVHRDQLLDQCHRALTVLGIPHGLIAAGRSELRHPVQVASVHTLTRRVEDLEAPDLYIIDECHHVRARTWARILEAHRSARLLGVTATPVRTDGSGLGVSSGGFFDCMIEGPTVAELTAMGFLSSFDYYQPPAGVDLSRVGIVGGDFNSRQLDQAVNRSTITGCAVEHYRRICPGAPAIAFCVSIAHAQAVAAQFAAAGFRAVALHSKMEKEQIRRTITGLGRGELQIVTSCDLISEGTDVPVVSAAILLRPTHSLGLFLQQVGRVLRPLPGKVATILDHVGNVGRHGLPDTDRAWLLDGEKKQIRKGETDPIPALKQCDRCFHVHRPQPMCPRCGFLYQVQGRKLESVDGLLEKVNREEARRAAELQAAEARAERGGARTLEELKKIGELRGYGKGWAYKVHQAREIKKARETARG